MSTLRRYVAIIEVEFVAGDHDEADDFAADLVRYVDGYPAVKDAFLAVPADDVGPV